MPPSPVAAVSATAAATNKATSRPRQPRRASDNKSARKFGPTPEPTAVLTPNPPLAAARISTGRRKQRPQAKNLPPLNTKSSLSSDSSSLTVQSAPARRTTTGKDLPPHLMTPSVVHTFDVKSDIEALVDRMRSVAMERPHTPGSHSHFDWASDDDDSLPDLPDWATNVKEDTKTDVKASSIISPILEDALKPLPNIEPGSPFTVPITVSASPNIASPLRLQIPAVEEMKEAQKQNVDDKAQKEESKPEAPQPATLLAVPESASHLEPPPQRAFPEKVVNTLPIHPSLPPKPTMTLEAAPAKRHTRQDSAPGHNRGKLSVTEANHKAQSGLAESMHAPKSGFTDSVHTPKSAADPEAKEKVQSPKDQAPEEGIAASMHAPGQAQSAPSHVSSYPIPDAPSQLRSRGPLRGHRQPHSASVTNFSHPDLERARADTAHPAHTRTQSSPPISAGAGDAHSRSLHSRPVITGDALSRLARTLGVAAPRRGAAVPIHAAAKD